MNVAPNEWAVAALSRGRAPPDVEDASVEDLLASAQFNGVLPLLEWRLRSSPVWQELPTALRVGLARGARDSAAQSLFREEELRKVGRLLEQQGIQTLLLKGNALGQWLYPNPYLRVSGDIDLLMQSRDAAERAALAFTELGYALEFSPATSHYEMTSRLVVEGVCRSELDLHWRLLNAAAYADIFTFEELWSESMPLPKIGGGLRGLCPMHALAHACLNRALDMQIGVPDRLMLLYDIHLLVGRMDAETWQQFLALVHSKRISGVCLRSINDTLVAFGTTVPDKGMDAMRRYAEADPIDWRRLQEWRYMQWHNLKTLPGTGAKVRWIWDKIFPTRSHLRELHGEGRWIQLMGRRLVRGVRRLRS